jgi:hypothetical protein
MAELDFVIEHKAGTKITHVDALSRNVGTVQQTGNLTRDEVRQEQSTDQFCVRQKELGITRKSEFFLDASGVMYRGRKGRPNQLVVPLTLVHKVIEENHDPVYAAHPGRKRTYELIRVKVLVAENASGSRPVRDAM